MVLRRSSTGRRISVAYRVGTGVDGQGAEELPFGWREVDRYSIARDAAPRHIDGDPSRFDQRISRWLLYELRTPEMSSHACLNSTVLKGFVT